MSAENAVELAALRVEVTHLTESVDALKTEVVALTAQANRWKGAFGVVLVVGGIIGWFASIITSWMQR